MLRLRAERKRLGLSQAALGQLARVPRPHVSVIERGLYLAHPGWKRRLAAAVGWKGELADLFAPLPPDQGGASDETQR